MLFVVDVDAARIALRARAIRCPQYGCSGRLRPWSSARVRTVTRRPGELVRLAPDRGMCVVCRVSQTLLPAWYVPRRSASIEVVGAVVCAFVNYGHRPNRIAEVLRMPRSTVRSWLHRLPASSPVLQQLTVRIAVEIGVDVAQPEVPSRPPCTPASEGLALALDQLARTAWGLTRPDPAHTAAGRPDRDRLHPPPRPGPPTRGQLAAAPGRSEPRPNRTGPMASDQPRHRRPAPQHDQCRTRRPVAHTTHLTPPPAPPTTRGIAMPGPESAGGKKTQRTATAGNFDPMPPAWAPRRQRGHAHPAKAGHSVPTFNVLSCPA